MLKVVMHRGEREVRLVAAVGLALEESLRVEVQGDMLCVAGLERPVGRQRPRRLRWTTLLPAGARPSAAVASLEGDALTIIIPIRGARLVPIPIQRVPHMGEA